MSSAALISRMRAGRSCRAARYSSSSTVRTADFTFRTATSDVGGVSGASTSRHAIAAGSAGGHSTPACWTMSAAAPAADTAIAVHRCRRGLSSRLTYRDSTYPPTVAGISNRERPERVPRPPHRSAPASPIDITEPIRKKPLMVPRSRGTGAALPHQRHRRTADRRRRAEHARRGTGEHQVAPARHRNPADAGQRDPDEHHARDQDRQRAFGVSPPAAVPPRWCPAPARPAPSPVPDTSIERALPDHDHEGDRVRRA